MSQKMTLAIERLVMRHGDLAIDSRSDARGDATVGKARSGRAERKHLCYNQFFSPRSFAMNKNKRIVTDAYQRIFGDLDVSAVDDCISKDFIQHNPTIADGPAGVKQLIELLISQGVQKQKIEFKHVIVDGNIVVLHSRYEMAGKEWRFIDIYRVENEKMVEHWDGMMQMPDVRANNNPLF